MTDKTPPVKVSWSSDAEMLAWIEGVLATKEWTSEAEACQAVLDAMWVKAHKEAGEN